MIGRLWRARCTPQNADTYEQLLRTEILPDLDRVDGCRGAYVFRREDSGHVEFLVLHLFDSMSVVRAFAGENYETAVVPVAAQELLVSFDKTAEHFEVRATPDE